MKASDLPQHLAVRPFAVPEALRSGVTRRRLRAADLVVPHHGVRHLVDASTVVDRCLAYLPVLREGQLFSHLTALELWGLPLPEGRREVAGDLHVAATGRREPHRPGVTGHRVASLERGRVHALPVVDPVTAWVQCSELLGLDDLVAVGDALLGSWSPLVGCLPLEQLATAVERRAGSRGCRVLREALPLLRPRVKSPQETALRLVLQRGGLPEPAINEDVYDDIGGWLGKPDLVYFESRVAVEYEGDHHRTNKKTFDSDIERRERFADAAWRTIRVTKTDLRDRPAHLVSRVRRWVFGR